MLLVNQMTIDIKSELVGRFVRSSIKGLQYALEHPDLATAEMVKRQSKHDIEFYKMAIKALIPLVDIPQSRVGSIDSKRWEQLLGLSFNLQRPGFDGQFLQGGL